MKSLGVRCSVADKEAWYWTGVHIRGGGFENHKMLVPVFFDAVVPLYFCATVYPQMSVAEQKSYPR
jgi:hypothetical protein